MHSGDYSFEKN